MASKVIVVVVLVWIASFGLIALYQSLQPIEGARTVVSPFREWDGEWKGEWVVLDAEGNEVERREIRRRYRHVVGDERFEQQVHSWVTDPATGETKLERGLNSAGFEGDELRRIVYKEMGSVVEQFDGAREGDAVVWTRDIPGARELFRHWVEDDVLRIEGWGMYGDTENPRELTMKGEFRRVE